MSAPWIGFGLDGTLAHYDGDKGVTHIGDPIPSMVDMVKRMVGAPHGFEARIVTARIAGPEPDLARAAIEGWCVKHIGTLLPVTCCIDRDMVHFYDCLVVQVVHNTGLTIGVTAP